MEMLLGALKVIAILAILIGVFGGGFVVILSIIALSSDLLPKKSRSEFQLNHSLWFYNLASILLAMGLAGLLYQQFMFREPFPICIIWIIGFALAIELGIQYLYRYIWIPPAKKDAEAETEKRRLADETHMAKARQQQQERQARQALIKAACSDAILQFAPEIKKMANMIAEKKLGIKTFMRLMDDRINSEVEKLKQ